MNPRSKMLFNDPNLNEDVAKDAGITGNEASDAAKADEGTPADAEPITS